ncbi:MAG: cation transporter [Lachnospiraceae bacterium]
MRKKIKLENLDCANCAAKMEDAIRKIKGVQEVSISFMTQKMVLEAEDDQFEDIMNQAKALVKKVEPDCNILY